LIERVKDTAEKEVEDEKEVEAIKLVKASCKHHSSYPNDMVCMEDSCKEDSLICMFCAHFGNHKGHKYDLIEKVAAETRIRLRNKLKEAQALCQRLHIAVGAAASEQKALRESSCDATLLKVRSEFDAVRAALAATEAAALAAVRGLAENKQRALGAQQQVFALACTTLHTVTVCRVQL
jgi:hypothetical protein